MATAQRFDDPRPFLACATAFLMQSEAAHGLLLGIAETLVRRPVPIANPPYLAVLADDGTVSGVALRTPPFNLVLSMQIAVPSTLRILAQDVYGVYPRLPGVLGPGTVARVFCQEWKDTSGQDSQIAAKLRVFSLEAVSSVLTPSGRLRRAVATDRELLVAWFAAFHEEALGARHAAEADREVEAFLSDPSWHLYLWEDGDRPVALAGARGATAHTIRIGPVYTPPESRRRGYASGLVAALSQAMLDTGYRCCTLFTNLANPTANHIYQEIGYRPVCDMDEYAFAEGNGEGRAPR